MKHNRTWRSLIALLLVVSLLCAPIPVFAAEETGADVMLSEELALKIRTDYLAKIKTERHFSVEPTLADVSIDTYCGSYHGVEVVIMLEKNMAYVDAIGYLNIDGVSFRFGSSSMRSLFFAYSDGAFYLLADAYKMGLLTRDDLLAVQKVYCGENDVPMSYPLKDVAEGAWYYEPVRFVTENELMLGVGGDCFSPNGTMSRAMLVTVLYRMAQSPEVSGQPFTDVPAGQWFSGAVAWAAQEKIVNGVGGGKFAPDSPITRAQLATILFRLSGEADDAPALDASFADAADVPAWAQAAMRWAVQNKVIEGMDASRGRCIMPGASATRAQTAAILMRMGRPAAQSSPIKDLAKGFSSRLTQTPALSEKGAEAITDFTVNLFRAARDSKKNSVMSPLSVLYALAMTANGAKGSTLSQMEQSFGMDIAATDDALLALRESLADKYTVLNIANSIWVKDGFDVQADFLQKNADYLQAAALQAPFDAATVDAMNDWISQSTDGMIPKMLNTLPPEAVLAFINAILFKAKWADPYSNTVERPFYRADGVVQTATMLPSSENIYLHDEKATGFLKRFESGKFAFAVVVPNKDVSLDDYIAGLDGAHLRKLLKGEVYDAVHAQMPKFKAEFDVDLMKVFPQLGITDALTPSADFGGIADGLYISDALHKAVIDVNEYGASAAAVTVIIASRSSIPERTATVIADRPYLYMIVDTETNLPLFIGANVTM